MRKFFILIFFNNYSENLLFLENYFLKKTYIYYKNISFKKKIDIFLVIFYIHNFKYIYIYIYIYIFSKMFDF